jgi:hypothetical protein
MHTIGDEYLRKLWQQQPVDRESLTYEAVEQKVATLQKAARRQRAVAALATVVAAVMLLLSLTGLWMWGDSSLRGSIIFGALFLSSAWSFWSVLRREPVQPKNVDRDLVSFINYAIDEHERQQDVGISLSRRRFIVPSVLVSLSGIYLAWNLLPEDKLAAGFIVFWLVFSQYLAHRGRMMIRKQVTYLSALRDRIQGS